MIEINDPKLCSGCGACVNICPKNIISLQEDEDGFRYPHIQKDECINCGLCEKVCPYINNTYKDSIQQNPDYPEFYAGQLINKEELFEVSSGGAAWAFTEAIIAEKGVVYGAVQKDIDFVEHLRTDNHEQAKALRRSKYLQSNTKNTFSEVKKDLKEGRIVLYFGTGCQIAGLLSFLHKPYENLYTCDVVCHGVPSQKVWRKYREEKEKKEGKRIVDLVFRDKSIGWKSNQYKITFDDGTIEKEKSTKQSFHAGYLAGLFYRPSCGCCKFAQLPKFSDLTLADFWKYKGKFHGQGNDIGVSLITVNSKKGKYLLKKSKDFLEIEKTDKDLALSSCRHLHTAPVENPERTAFFAYFKKHGYFKAADKFIFKKETKTERLKKIAKRIINYRMKITDLEKRDTITAHYSLYNNKAVFVEKFSELYRIPLCYGKDKMLLSSNRIIRGVARRIKIKTITPQSVLSKAERNMALIDALKLLAQKRIPVFFYNRVGKEKVNFTYSPSAQRRMELGLSFPKMYDNIEKYEEEFKEIFGNLYSKDYVEKIGKIPQVIQKGDGYCHEDCSSEYINVIQGKRITCYQPEKYKRTLHIYGRCGAFGYAVEDKYTLPSQIQLWLKKRGIDDIKVVNHGLWGGSDEYLDHNFLNESIGMKEGDIVLFYRKHLNKRLLKHWGEAGVWYHEITHDWHKREEAKWCFYDKPGHMNHIGYSIAAELIVDDLISHDFSCRPVEKKTIENLKPERLKDYLKSQRNAEFYKEIQVYTNGILKDYPLPNADAVCGSIVMNCNPFTKGHRYLIEHAASQVDRLYVFVVEEDKSFFKFNDRLEMVKQGAADLKNVVVVPSGKFMISALTFPEYFMKDYVKEKNFDVTMDLEIFCKYIAAPLNIKKRFAGQEPFDPVTSNYNENMRKILPQYGMEFCEIPRLSIDDEHVINATEVRRLLKEGNFNVIKEYVPETTLQILKEKYVI
jgi:cytidyltransferase-like protein